MKQVLRSVRSQLRRASGMERFVRFIVAGGIALVAGLWIVTLSRVGAPSWLLGVGLAVLGSGGLLVGIWSEIEA